MPRSVHDLSPHTLVRALRTWLLIAASVGLQTVVFLGVGIVVILMTLLSEAAAGDVVRRDLWVGGKHLAVLIGLVFRSRMTIAQTDESLPYENATDSHGYLAILLAVCAPGLKQVSVRHCIPALGGEFEARPILPWLCEHPCFTSSLPEACGYAYSCRQSQLYGHS